jgi:hypothetical protein
VVVLSAAAGGPYGGPRQRLADAAGGELRIALERNAPVPVGSLTLLQPAFEVGMWWGHLRGRSVEGGDGDAAARRWSARLRAGLHEVADGVQLYGALGLHFYDFHDSPDGLSGHGGASGALGLLVAPKALWSSESGSGARAPWLRGFLELGGEAQSRALSPTVTVGLSVRLVPAS